MAYHGVAYFRRAHTTSRSTNPGVRISNTSYAAPFAFGSHSSQRTAPNPQAPHAHAASPPALAEVPLTAGSETSIASTACSFPSEEGGGA